MTTQSFQLDTQRSMPALDYLKWIKQARKSGKGLGSLLREIVSLQFGKAKISPEEYFLYQLYDDQRYTPEAKKTFVGIHGLNLNSPWADVANDKPSLTATLMGLGFPVPETQGFVHDTRSFAGAHIIRTPDDLRKFLREDAKYPIFGKPFDSACSLGVADIAGFDYKEDAIILSDDRRVDLDEFVSEVKRFRWQYLLQTRMRPHADLIPFVGDRVSSVRMFVLADDDGIELVRASWKIPADENGADNFWRAGNLLAGIDVETGEIIKTMLRTPDGTQEVTSHPRTGTEITGTVFPEWEAMRDVVLRAAPCLPGCYMQGWDVALTDKGPILVELEGDGGDPIMEQLCFETGLLQGRFEKLYDQKDELNNKKQTLIKSRRRGVLKRNISALAGGGAANDSESADAETPNNETPTSEATAEASRSEAKRSAKANKQTANKASESSAEQPVAAK